MSSQICNCFVRLITKDQTTFNNLPYNCLECNEPICFWDNIIDIISSSMYFECIKNNKEIHEKLNLPINPYVLVTVKERIFDDNIPLWVSMLKHFLEIHGIYNNTWITLGIGRVDFSIFIKCFIDLDDNVINEHSLGLLSIIVINNVINCENIFDKLSVDKLLFNLSAYLTLAESTIKQAKQSNNSCFSKSVCNYIYKYGITSSPKLQSLIQSVYERYSEKKNEKSSIRNVPIIPISSSSESVPKIDIFPPYCPRVNIPSTLPCSSDEESLPTIIKYHNDLPVIHPSKFIHYIPIGDRDKHSYDFVHFKPLQKSNTKEKRCQRVNVCSPSIKSLSSII